MFLSQAAPLAHGHGSHKQDQGQGATFVKFNTQFDFLPRIQAQTQIT